MSFPENLFRKKLSFLCVEEKKPEPSSSGRESLLGVEIAVEISIGSKYFKMEPFFFFNKPSLCRYVLSRVGNAANISSRICRNTE